MTQKQLEEINLYPEMNAKIGGILVMSDESVSLYAAKLIKTLQSENAELRARLDKAVELPCEVGDTIYFLSTNLKKIIPHEIISYYCRPDRIAFECKSVSIIKDSCFAFSCCAIGKTVFLTREDAENALKERGSDE